MFVNMNNKRVINTNGNPMYISYKIERKTVCYNLYHSNDFDNNTFTPKKNCKLFRLHSENTGSWPIVSINIEKKLVYFLKDYDLVNSDWETKGYKILYSLDIHE